MAYVVAQLCIMKEMQGVKLPSGYGKLKEKEDHEKDRKALKKRAEYFRDRGACTLRCVRDEPYRRSSRCSSPLANLVPLARATIMAHVPAKTLRPDQNAMKFEADVAAMIVKYLQVRKYASPDEQHELLAEGDDELMEELDE